MSKKQVELTQAKANSGKIEKMILMKKVIQKYDSELRLQVLMYESAELSNKD